MDTRTETTKRKGEKMTANWVRALSDASLIWLTGDLRVEAEDCEAAGDSETAEEVWNEWTLCVAESQRRRA